MNAYTNNEETNNEVSPNPATDDKNINANSEDGETDYEVTIDTPKEGVKNETIDN